MLDGNATLDIADISTSHGGARAFNSFALAGMACRADPSGALLIEDGRVMVVADLHFEKASAYARRGVFLPPYDTAATLARLAQAVARLVPRAIVALGDSFHDRCGAERLGAADAASLRQLQRGRNWIWVAGNHDPAAPRDLGGEACEEWRHGTLVLRHEPQPNAQPGEIAGHLHPVARIAGRGISLRRRCFVADASRCVLPAFGALAGGLNLRDPAFRPLFAGPVMAHVLGRAQVYAVRGARCLADANAPPSRFFADPGTQPPARR